MSSLTLLQSLHENLSSRAQVKSVFGDSYRVNVFIGPDVASFKVAHGYFLTADGDGKILLSSPAITRVY